MGNTVDEPRTCIVDVSGSQVLRMEAELLGANKPSVVLVYVGGELAEQYTYSYDENGLLSQETLDHQGTAPATPPDGVPEQVKTFEHTDFATIVRYDNSDTTTSTASYDLDDHGNVTRLERGYNIDEYVLGEDDRIESSEHAGHPAIDPARSVVWTYDASGRPLSRSVTRPGSAPITTNYTYETGLGRFVVSSEDRVLSYSHAKERVTRIEVKSPSQALWTLAIDPLANGGTVVTVHRDSAARYELSAGCGYEVPLPETPKPPRRPGPVWLHVAPELPVAFLR